MVEEPLLTKRSRPPALHARARDCDPVDATGLVRDVSADVVEAPAPEELALSGHVGLTLEAVDFGAISFFLEDRASDAELGILCEALQEKLEMVPLEGDVRVQIA